MPPQRARSPARLLAPAVLVVLAVAVVLIVLSSAGGDGSPKGGDTTEEGTAITTPSKRTGHARGSTYTVKRDDTFGSIAEKTGVEVERLQELNPQVDPQALIAGQKIKLRQ